MKSIKLTAILFLSTLLINCGGDAKKDEKKKIQLKSTSSSSAETSADVEGTVLSIYGNDMMKFNKTELRAKAGDKVTLTLRHTGKMAKNIMGHNFVLLKQGTNIQVYATKALESADKEYIVPGDETIAHTRMLGGGESDTITFDAPAPGVYDFICSFPGHVSLMKGKFIVE
jgi:azurin